MKAIAIERMRDLPDKLDFINASKEAIADNIAHEINDCFNTMASYWQQGAYTQIVKHANDLPLHCLCDIRVCVYYLYSLWTTNQNIGTERIISTLTIVLTHQQRPWQIALKKKSDKTLGKILVNSTTLFFRKMLGRLEKLLDKSEEESPVQVLASLEGFNASISDLKPKTDNELENLLKNVSDYFFSLQTAIEEKQKEQKPINLLNAEETAEEKTDNSAEVTVSTAPSLTQNTLIDPSIFKPSHPLQLLFQRIQLLHQLVEKGQELKAAIVLEDIQRELDNFNPLLYFPEYFSAFAGLRAKNASNLEPFFCHQQSYQWKVLHEYYQTDMAAFLALEESNKELAPPHSGYLPGGYDE